MNKTETLNYLDQHNVHYEKTEHQAVYNMAELSELHLPYPEADAKIFSYEITKSGTIIF